MEACEVRVDDAEPGVLLRRLEESLHEARGWKS